VADIDTIVRQVRYTGWNETQEGDRTVRREVRLILKKYGLPTTGDLLTVPTPTSGKTTERGC